MGKRAGNLHHFYDFQVFAGHITVIFFFVRQLAVGAVLDSLFRDPEISAAFGAEGIERAIAEKAIKIIRVCTLVTGKVFTFFMAEKGKFFILPIVLFHDRYLRFFLNKKTASERRENLYEGRRCSGVDNASFKYAEGMNASEAESPAI